MPVGPAQAQPSLSARGGPAQANPLGLHRLHLPPPPPLTILPEPASPPRCMESTTDPGEITASVGKQLKPLTKTRSANSFVPAKPKPSPAHNHRIHPSTTSARLEAGDKINQAGEKLIPYTQTRPKRKRKRKQSSQTKKENKNENRNVTGKNQNENKNSDRIFS